jgi:Pvc16 N-terminal domain
MATFRAVSAVTAALVRLLESHYSPGDFNGNQLEFKVYLAGDFQRPMDAGVSVFLYRVYVNMHQRTPPGRLDPVGRRRRTQLPLDLHILLTAWAKDASLQHTIAGWMMRIIEDTPSLPAGLLNNAAPGVFLADETVELSLAELDTETLFRIWEVIAANAYQISVPYVARAVRIETDEVLTTARPVQERDFDFAVPSP